MLEFNLGKIFFLKTISFYKVGDWSIFVETNVVYLHTQKHKYTQKNN